MSEDILDILNKRIVLHTGEDRSLSYKPLSMVYLVTYRNVTLFIKDVDKAIKAYKDPMSHIIFQQSVE